MALLQVENLSVQFGGLKALNDVSLQVDTGDFVGLIGPNGAGNSDRTCRQPQLRQDDPVQCHYGCGTCQCGNHSV